MAGLTLRYSMANIQLFPGQNIIAVESVSTISPAEKEVRLIERIKTIPLTVKLVLVAAFLAHGVAITNGFAYDDTTEILRNKLIKVFADEQPFQPRFEALKNLLTKDVWYWRILQDKDLDDKRPSTPYYRPVFSLYLVIAYTIFHEAEPLWHLANILLHLLVVVMVYLIAEKITGDVRVSSLAAAIFALHPLKVESVAWVCGVTDPLLSVFLLSSFYAYMLYRESNQIRLLVTAVGLFFFAAFSKEPAISLVAMVAAYELWVINRDVAVRRRLATAIRFSLPFLAISVAYFAARYHALGFLLNDNRYTEYPPDQVLLTIPLVIWKYLGLLFWPLELSLFHEVKLVTSPFSLRFMLPTAGLAVLGCAAFLLWKSIVGRFALLWFAINLLPVLNISSFGEGFIVQERYLYVPSLGFSILAAIGLLKLPLDKWIPGASRRKAQMAVAMLILLLFSVKTFAQTRIWKDDLTLYTHGAEVADDEPTPHYILGHHYVKLQRADKVIEEFERFLELDPRKPEVIVNLVAARLQMYETTLERAHLDRAIGLCQKGLNIDNRRAELWDALGHAYTYETELRNYVRARGYFDQALRIQPELTISVFHLGATYAKEGDYENALRYLETARDQQPYFPDTYLFLGYTYPQKGRLKEAVEALTRFLELQPNAKDADKHRNELAKLQAKLQETEPKPITHN